MNGNFSSYLEKKEIEEKWLKIKKYFFLKESTYDITNRCNLECEGCYYYSGDKSLTKDEVDLTKWEDLFQSEKDRGITFVVLAGAEPALAPDRCRIAYKHIKYGAIATNGIRKIPEDIQFKIHISVWGNDEYSLAHRKVKNCLDKQLEAYNGDDRAVYIYTFTKENIDHIDEIAARIHDSGGQLSFNQFSSPENYNGPLRLDADARAKMRDKMYEMIEKFPESVLYSSYNAEVHSHDLSLHDQFSCPYPRMNKKNKVIGLGKTFRQYRTDLSRDDSVACCVPDTDCKDCRHYASGSAVVTSKMLKHVETEEMFRKWLDYVDTYLAVWVNGYEKSKDLFIPATMEARV